MPPTPCPASGNASRSHRRCTAAALVVAGTLAIAAAATPAAADPPGTFLGSARQLRLTPPRTRTAPAVDGRVDPAEWQAAAVLDSFTHGRPVEGVRDTLGTRCLVMYDTQHLYVAFVCGDRPGQVQAPVTGRDDIWSGDWVGVSIDSYHDQQKSYFLCANPRGIQADGVDQEGRDSDTAPDYQYTSQGRVTPEGFEVEFRIPFKSLRFPPADMVTFGFQAIRDVRRNGTHMYWAPVTRDIAGYHKQMGELRAFEGVRPGRNLEVNPYVTGSQAGAVAGNTLQWEDPVNRQGFGLKYGLTSAVTADVAVTPDFSQVEADAGVIDVNERFAIFFQEKRPFFLEGVDLFTMPMNLVYTRRIVDPLYGAKVTGKVGARTGVALLHAADRSPGRSIPGLPDAVNPYLDEWAYSTIARVRQDVLGNSHLGALVTDRRQHDASNRVASLDGRFTFAKHWTTSFLASHSWTRDRDFRGAIARLDSAQRANADPRLASLTGASRDGFAWTGAVARNTRRLDSEFYVTNLSRDFDPQTGFVSRPDVATFEQWNAAHWYPRKSRVQAVHLRLGTYQTFDHGGSRHFGQMVDGQFRPEIEVQFPNNTWVGGGFNRLFTRFEGRRYDPRVRVFFFTGSERFRTVRGGVWTSYGSDVVFAESVPGKSWNYELWSDLRLTDQLAASLNFDGVRIWRNEPSTSRFADVVIPRVRVTYQFNREMALRAITQLVDERRYDTASSQVERSRDLSLDLLASYQLRPGTVFYLGYGSSLESQGAYPLRVAHGNLFAKASWLLQL